MVDLFFLIIIVFLLISFVQIIRLYFLIGKQKRAKVIFDKRKNEIFYLNFLLSNAVSEDKSIQESFPLYLNRLKETVGWAYHSMFRLDEERQVVIARFTGYLPDWYIDELSNKVLVKVGDASVGRAIATKQPVIINSAKIDPRFQNVTSYGDRTGYRSLSCYPVMGEFKTYGGICTYSAYENNFTLRDVQFFLTCANLFGAILENKLLQNYLKIDLTG